MTSDKYATSVSGPGALITAVPALLGFVPERSLILVTFDGDGTEIGTTMRHDLSFGDDGVPTPAMLGVIEHLTAVCESYGVVRVVAVIVDDAYPIDSDEYRRLAAIVHRLLADVGLHGAFVTAAITAGSMWQTVWDSRSHEVADDQWYDGAWAGAPAYSGPETGLVGDPMISPVAVARAVTKGRQVMATRSEMAQHLAQLPHCDDADCDAHVVSAADDLAYRDLAADRDRLTGQSGSGETGSVDQTFIDWHVLQDCAAAFGPGGPRDERAPLDVVVDHLRRLQERQDLEFALSLIYRGATGALTCDELRVFDRALRELYVRDALMALAVTDVWTEAEQMWTVLCRRLRGRGQAAAATLLGFVHYVHGNGAMAGIAFDLALEGSPGYSMAVLYSEALNRGMSPHVIADCAQTGYLVARTLGVELPQPVIRPAA